MSRYYYSDSDDSYQTRRYHPTTNTRHYIQRNGWTSEHQPISSRDDQSMIRIVVDSPYPQKCDFFIDISKPGKIIVTARRRQPSSANSSNYVDYPKQQDVIQTYEIPHDADVDRLIRYVERDGNLIIKIPRRQYSYRDSFNSNNMNMSRPRVVNNYEVEQMLTSPTSAPSIIRDRNSSNRHGGKKKLEYRIDCKGYEQEDLEVFIQGHNLIVQGERKSTNSNRNVSKKFSRKISLPPDVDLSKVVSYLDPGINGGELRIEAPLNERRSHTIRQRDYQSDEYENHFPQRSPSLDFDRKTKQQRRHRHGNYYEYRPGPSRRVRSADGNRNPLHVSSDADDFDASPRPRNPRRRVQNYERQIIDHNPRSNYEYHSSRTTNHKDGDLRF